MTKLKSNLLLVCLLTLLNTTLLSATTYTFTGNAPVAKNAWNKTENWAGGVMPKSPLAKDDIIIIDSECYFDIPSFTVNGKFKVNNPHKFTINNATVLTFAAGSTLEAYSSEGGMVVYGTIDLQEGALFIKFNPANIEFKPHSSFIVNGEFRNYLKNSTYIRANLSGTGTVTMNGILDLAGANVKPGTQGTGVLNLTSGVTLFSSGVAEFQVNGTKHNQIKVKGFQIVDYKINVDVKAATYADGTEITLIDGEQGDVSKFEVNFTGDGAEGWSVKVGTGADLIIQQTKPAAANNSLGGKVFVIQSKAPNANGRVIDADGYTLGKNGTKIQLWDKNGVEHQSWKFIASGKGADLYYIVSMSSKAGAVKFLEISYADLGKNGGVVQLWEDNRNAAGDGEPNQLWKVTQNADGSYRIASAHPKSNGASLDADGYTQNKNGGKVQIWQALDNANQKWNLIAQ